MVRYAMKHIPAWLYFVMFLLVAYGIAREVWYQHWNRYAKVGRARL